MESKTLIEADSVAVQHSLTAAVQNDNIPVNELRRLLAIDPVGIQRVYFDSVLDLTTLGAKFLKALTVPSGAVVRFTGVYVVNDVVAGGTSVALGLGAHAATTNTYGTVATLIAGSTFSKLTNAAALSSNTDIDLTVAVTGGATVGDTNISAGRVRVVVIYDVPAVLGAA